jgi:hypothetical protein
MYIICFVIILQFTCNFVIHPGIALIHSGAYDFVVLCEYDWKDNFYDREGEGAMFSNDKYICRIIDQNGPKLRGSWAKT